MMRFLTLVLFALSGGMAAAESITCYPSSACYAPQGECDPPEVNIEPGVFDIGKNQISLSAPDGGPTLVFTVINIASGSGSTSYFTENDLGFTMFTLFNSGNLAMAATRNTDGGIAAIAYFTCEGAPWKTS